MADDKDLGAEYNESLLKIGRLNNHWIALAKIREDGELGKVKGKLDSIELELIFNAEKLDKKPNNNYVEQLEEINDKLESSAKTKRIIQFFKALKEKEKLLREIQQQSGMGSKFKDSSEDEWE